VLTRPSDLSPNHKVCKAHVSRAHLISHRGRIASILVNTLTTAKRATNRRSLRTAARAQPSAANDERMTNSLTRASIYRVLFISPFVRNASV
jgi:hypothetical protein